MIAFFFAIALTAQQPCLVDGERIRGELRFVESEHPNGTKMRSAFAVLVEARCLEDEMGRSEGKWIQLAPAREGAFDGIPPGSTIVVEADDYFTPHTAWHTGDIVALNVRVVGYELQ